MLTKKEFVSVMKTLEKSDKFYDAIDKVCREFGVGDMSAYVDMVGEIDSALIDVLENMFDDQCDTIGWWMYECDYGKNEKCPAEMWWRDNQTGEKMHMIINTPEELYDFLVEGM